VKWTREVLAAKAREWYELYGEPPTYTDWDLTVLRQNAERRSEEAQRAWERYARYRDGDWPSRASITAHFGHWPELLKAAHLPAHVAKYRRENPNYTSHWRRRAR
jgi:hypothetical protein